MIPSTSISPKLLLLLLFTLAIGAMELIFGGFFPLPGGRMGHDFVLSLSGLLDGYFWFRNNGLEPPWFTPSFCAGQPFFADPQSIYYSLPQFLAFFTGPLAASHLTLLIASTLMFWGGYLLMRRAFGAGQMGAILVAILLMFNGFLPQRLIVGHLGYHGFALAPWLALLLLVPLRGRLEGLLTAVGGGVILGYWVQSGLGTLILPAGLGVLAVGLFHHWAIGGSLHRLFGRGAFAFLFALALSASKLSAAFAFLSQFPRTDYALPGAATPIDGLLVVLSGLFLPSQLAFDLGSPWLTNVQWTALPHEWAYGFTLAPLILLPLLPLLRLVNGPSLKMVHAQSRWIILPIALILLWPLAFNVWQADWNAFLKTIPILNATSVPLRWSIVYILPLAVILGFWFDRTPWHTTLAPALALGGCILGVVGLTANEPREFYFNQEFDATPIIAADRAVRAGAIEPKINQLGTEAGFMVDGRSWSLVDNTTFLGGVSQVACYNPIFGYRLEKLTTDQLAIGPALAERDKHLNLKNPACYLFPEENRCHSGDSFRADQIDQATAMLTYRPYSFEVSPRQAMADRVSQWTLALTAAAGLLGVWLAFRRRNRRT